MGRVRVRIKSSEGGYLGDMCERVSKIGILGRLWLRYVVGIGGWGLERTGFYREVEACSWFFRVVEVLWVIR